MDPTQRDDAPDESEARRRREAERLIRQGFDREVAARRLERYAVDPETGHYVYRRPEAGENTADPRGDPRG